MIPSKLVKPVGSLEYRGGDVSLTHQFQPEQLTSTKTTNNHSGKQILPIEREPKYLEVTTHRILLYKAHIQRMANK